MTNLIVAGICVLTAVVELHSVLESGDPIKDFYDEDDLASAVVYLLSSPLSQLKAALKNCDDFAWTWHCNLACIGLDSGGAHEVANRRAAQFMKNAFGVDVTTQENWKQLERQWGLGPGA